jgi:uncharacterized protein (DUF1501 family)
MDNDFYNEYRAMRTSVSLPQGAIIPLSGTENSNIGTVGLHPSLVSIAKRFNQRQALIVANVGPMVKPLTKDQLLNNSQLQPEGLFSHPAGSSEWQSAGTAALPNTGWGGRMADLLSSQSGALPPVLSTAGSSFFSVGHNVQGVAVQSQGTGGNAIPIALAAPVSDITATDVRSNNRLVSEVAKLRASSVAEQALLTKAISHGSQLKAQFSTSTFGASMRTIAQIINGRSVTQASRQIFYCNQGNYDHHQNLLSNQAGYLSDLDTNIGAFMDSLDEMGLTNDVLICTHSDFNRTMQCNTTLGTDHGWGSHQFIIGGGNMGGRILGTFPDFELGGRSDFVTQGVWIPTTSVTQMTAGIGTWLGLNSAQIAEIFPNLGNFSDGALQF